MKPIANGQPKEEIVNVKVGDQKAEEPLVSFIRAHRDSMAVEMPPTVATQQVEQASPKWRSHYICSILSTICCFGPLSVIGLMHFIAAKAEYSKGNIREAMKKKRQAKVWTSAAIMIGLIVLLALGVLLTIGYSKLVTEQEKEEERSEEKSKAMSETMAELKAIKLESLKELWTTVDPNNDWPTKSFEPVESTTSSSTSSESTSTKFSTTPTYNSRFGGSTTSIPTFIYFLYHIPSTNDFTNNYYPSTTPQIPEDYYYYDFMDGTTFLPRTTPFPEDWENFETTPWPSSSSSSTTDFDIIDRNLDVTTFEPSTTEEEFGFTSSVGPTSTNGDFEFSTPDFTTVMPSTTEGEFESTSTTEPSTDDNFSTSTELPTTESEVVTTESASRNAMKGTNGEETIQDALLEGEMEEEVALQEAQLTQLQTSTGNSVTSTTENMQGKETSTSSTSSSSSSTTTPNPLEVTSTSDLNEALHPAEITDNLNEPTSAGVPQTKASTEQTAALDVVNKVLPTTDRDPSARPAITFAAVTKPLPPTQEGQN